LLPVETNNTHNDLEYFSKLSQLESKLAHLTSAISSDLKTVQDETRQAHSQLRQGVSSLSVKQSSLEQLIQTSIQQNLEGVENRLHALIESVTQREFIGIKGQMVEVVTWLFHNNLESILENKVCASLNKNFNDIFKIKTEELVNVVVEERKNTESSIFSLNKKYNDILQSNIESNNYLKDFTSSLNCFNNKIENISQENDKNSDNLSKMIQNMNDQVFEQKLINTNI